MRRLTVHKAWKTRAWAREDKSVAETIRLWDMRRALIALAAAAVLAASVAPRATASMHTYSYRLSVSVKGRLISVLTLQYGFLHAGRSVVFTYTTLPASARFYSGVFAASAQSIRFS